MMDWIRHLYSREVLESRMFLIPLFPLLGFLLNGIFGKRYFSKNLSGVIGTGAALLSFIWALLCVLNNDVYDFNAGERVALHATYGRWLATSDFSCSFGLYIDKLSSVMILIVTGIGTLIHLYSMGYMAHDKGYSRFFAYLNLFLFSMILLVLGDNILMTFVGWEGVGLCSYLLIGFWYEEGANAAAGMKAFVVNRIGDLGFLMGVFTLIALFGTVNYVAPPEKTSAGNITRQTTINEQTHVVTLPANAGLLDYTAALRGLYVKEPGHGAENDALLLPSILPNPGVKADPAISNLDLSQTLAPKIKAFQGYGLEALITLACLCLFVGAMGKSAQIPLYVWLPDAMAGPTPVSALIHAATMVTAGIYMICRLHSLFAFSATALAVIAVVGASTALFSALIGLTQLDIKKVLAYSTVSQLGYMFLGLGAGMFSLGIFHVLTHAFFKALLFLGSGSVIHAMSGEQDMRKMGGLAGKLKVTFITMLIGALALSGVPFFSGWYSKDAILAHALARSQDSHSLLYLVCYIMGVIAAFCTAFYTFRLIFLTFFGENRASEEVKHHIHESPWTMLLPLVVLAFLSLAGGWMFVDKFEATPLESLGIQNVEFHHEEAVHHVHVLNLIVTALAAAAGIGLAALRYGKGGNVPAPEKSSNPLYKASLNKFYVDEIYDAVIVFPFRVGSELLHWIADVIFIDGLVTGSAYLVSWFSGKLRRIQTGVLNTYAMGILGGALAVLVFLYLSLK